ncbi:preprotein translocase subunit SecY [Pseudobdellovibrio exovorus]|uniref:Protein translocase subunit SecY n=1 Tax=Pseudobdellovibrio exovorus JSS TaxID=1184267 RepID=M4VA70_9BACT|nr:preprotein translocase subunit SecY [Pseudobdellovibrio exovorus]AGH96108.1 preprotein translocase subunit SecY [Pseudobdellovibrio exovorus JSS]
MASQNSDSKGLGSLKSKIFFTLICLAVYRIGVHIPTPGVNGNAVSEFFNSQSRGIFGMFNTFSGGALEQFSVFALGIMPYISASIIFQLLTSAVPHLEALKKEGEAGRKKISQYTKYATVVLAVVQGYGISSWLSGQTTQMGQSLLASGSLGILPFKFVTVLTLVAGTCFIMWLGDQITEKGIGNGTSLIIFTGIAASIPSGASHLYDLVKTGELRFIIAAGLLLFMVLVIAAVIFMEVAQRRIAIQYSQRLANNNMGSLASSHLPIKINFPGVIPPIFASSLLMFPSTLAQFVNVPWLTAMNESLNPNGVIFNILFVLFIVFFSFFYTDIVFNADEVSENLKKSGAFVPGIRAGKSTAEFIRYVLDRINVLGCLYLCIICILPGLMVQFLNIPFHFGGTSLLILVGVAIDTSQQIQSHLLSSKYDSFLKGVKIRSRRVQF